MLLYHSRTGRSPPGLTFSISYQLNFLPATENHPD